MEALRVPNGLPAEQVCEYYGLALSLAVWQVSFLLQLIGPVLAFPFSVFGIGIETGEPGGPNETL